MAGLRFGALVCLGALLLPAQEIIDPDRKVSEFTLSNGLRFIVLERHQVPVVSFHTYVNVGWAQDPPGKSGLAHMLEHMAFKGTESVGSLNWPAEKRELDLMEDVYGRYEAERNKGVRANAGKMATLEANMRVASTAAQSLQESGQFLKVFKENGGVEISCHTSPDGTETAYSLPSNRMELWFLMESQRLAHPVFRDLDQERTVMLREAQIAVESKAAGKLQQALFSTAFAVDGYRNPGLGWPSDVVNLGPSDIKAFFSTYFVPANMVIAIVGDVDLANAQRLAERYFSALPSRPLPALARTSEPEQFGPKTVTLVANAAPMLMVGYKRPKETSHDDAAFDVLRMALAEVRTGVMFKELVEQKRLAQSVDAVATAPAGRYGNLFILSVVPAENHTVEENQKALEDLLARFRSRPLDPQTLARVKNMLKVRAERIMGSNQRLAALLTEYDSNYGSWQKLFSAVRDLEHVTADDVQRVAAQYLIPNNMTVAYIASQSQPVSAGGVQ